MSAREEIAAAVSTVDGITCTPLYEGETADGSAYVELIRDEYPNEFGGETYWEVCVLMPTDAKEAQDAYTRLRGPVVKALRESRALVVTGTRPDQLLTTDGPTRNLMVVEGHRETEEE